MRIILAISFLFLIAPFTILKAQSPKWMVTATGGGYYQASGQLPNLKSTGVNGSLEFSYFSKPDKRLGLLLGYYDGGTTSFAATDTVQDSYTVGFRAISARFVLGYYPTQNKVGFIAGFEVGPTISQGYGWDFFGTFNSIRYYRLKNVNTTALSIGFHVGMRVNLSDAIDVVLVTRPNFYLGSTGVVTLPVNVGLSAKLGTSKPKARRR